MELNKNFKDKLNFTIEESKAQDMMAFSLISQTFQ
jgi:hypothetical protein